MDKNIEQSIPSWLYFHKNKYGQHDSMTDPREHVQNVHGSLELVIQDSDSM